MKNTLLILLFTFISPIIVAQDTLTFVKIAGTPDQTIGEQILKEVYKKLSITIVVRAVPGKRALYMASSGEVDGEVHRIWRIGDEYPTLLRVLPPLNFIKPTAFSKNNNIKINGWNSIKKYSIGRTRGVRYAEVGTVAMENVSIHDSSFKTMFMLHNNRIDIAVTDLFNGKIQIVKQGLEGIHPLSPPLEVLPLYHYLHKKYSTLVPRGSKILLDMEKSGELKRLRDTYIKQFLDDVIKKK